jgi:CDP-diglyceride synthetase
MDRFDCNIIVMFVLGVLNRGGHMDKFDCNIIVLFVFPSIKHY